MARRNTSESAGVRNYVFNPVDFSVEDRIDINAWLEQTPIETDDAMLKMVEAGFKLAISHTDGNDYYTVTLTETRHPKRKGKLAVYSFRHADMAKGMRIMFWFFNTHLDQGNTRAVSEEDKYDW